MPWTLGEVFFSARASGSLDGLSNSGKTWLSECTASAEEESL